MREKLKNDLLMLLDKNVDVDTLRKLEPQNEIILSYYEVEQRKTEIIPYGSDIPETVQTYIVSKKISGLLDKTLYLYRYTRISVTDIVSGFFCTVLKKSVSTIR